MRRMLRFTLVLLAAVLSAVPAAAGVRVVGSGRPAITHGKFGFDFGPRIAFSIPTGESDVFDHGIDAAVTWTTMQTRRSGIGLELGYRHWPSPEAGAAFDAMVNTFSNALGGSSIQGTRVFVDAVALAMHVRVIPLVGRAVTPWTEAGVGVVRSVGTIAPPVERVSGPGFLITLTSSHHVTWSPDFAVRAGFDVSSQRGVRVGPDLSYRWVFIDGDRYTSFTAFAVGLHVRFAMP